MLYVNVETLDDALPALSQVFPQMSSKRVLTMEFIDDAVAVSDVKSIRSLGLR